MLLIVLNALGPKYELFVTSITTCIYPSLSFVDLQAMLLDQELHLEVVALKVGQMYVVIVEKDKSSENHSSKKKEKCQICTKK